MAIRVLTCAACVCTKKANDVHSLLRTGSRSRARQREIHGGYPVVVSRGCRFCRALVAHSRKEARAPVRYRRLPFRANLAGESRARWKRVAKYRFPAIRPRRQLQRITATAFAPVCHNARAYARTRWCALKAFAQPWVGAHCG